MANAEAATVADFEKWLDGPGRIPASFVSKYEISPSTHATYVSRARKVLEDYYRCGGDVRAWTSRTASGPKATPQSKSIELPLSDGRTAQLSFPHDLSRAEARTIAAQLEGLKAVFLARAEVEGDG